MPKVGLAALVYLLSAGQVRSARAPPDNCRTSKAKIILQFGCSTSVFKDVGGQLNDVWQVILLAWVI